MATETRRASIWGGLALGGAAAFVFIALASIGEVLLGIPNPAYRLFESVSGLLPGAIITVSIDTIVRLVHWAGAGSTAAAAKTIESALAIGLAVAFGAAFGAVLAVLARRHRHTMRIAIAIAAVCGVAYVVVMARSSSALMIAVTLAGFVAWGAVTGALISAMTASPAVSPERRHALVILGVAGAAVGALALGVTRWLGRGRARVAAPDVEDQAARTSGPAASPPRDALAARFVAVPGTRSELTSNAEFYRVDINITPPSIAGASWRLEVGGLVAKPMSLSLDELRARPAVSQMITLECISNPVGGDLIGTSRWTGISLRDLVDELGVAPAARALSFFAADGFYESASLDDVRDPRALLVYEMNGEPLPEAHGFPLRLYLPDRHGMKLPKWIQRIEAVAEPRPGYWVERGWSATAIPHTTSVIDTVRRADARRLSIGGIAYAGARGIRRVEVQIDSGPWMPARLRRPALGPLTWVQWRLDVVAEPRPHTFRVRAVDGTGALQDVQPRPPHPDGATGFHALTA
jgi:DMSO/TMAO reductase YedYZ molybdopterin-dependent catalytic subunit